MFRRRLQFLRINLIASCLTSIRATGFIVTLAQMISHAASGHDIRNAKVLVVDDDPLMCKFLETALKQLHVHSVRVCEDGYSALKLLGSFCPHVILTDIHMKPIDGFEFVRRLHNDLNPVRRDTPVIFMSADSSAETLKAALPLKAASYIVKPPAIEILRTKIEQALNLHDHGA